MKIEWDFEKGLLAFMALLILAGVGVIFWQRSIAKELEARQPVAESQLARIGETAQEIQVLRIAINDDEAIEMRPFDYLEDRMVESRIGKNFSTSPGSGAVDPNGFTDTVWVLKPKKTGLDFDRRALAVFMIHIEAKTTIMKVTRLKLDASTRRGAGPDDWKPLIEVTERRATSI
jgi:hypothetical protein